MRITDGENIEIFIDEENIILKKYSLLNKIDDYAEKLADVIRVTLKKDVIITDTDRIVSVTGRTKKACLNEPISAYLSACIKKRENICEKKVTTIKLTDNRTVESAFCLSTIIVSGDAIGLIILLSEDGTLSDIDIIACQIVTKFLSKMLED